MRTCPFVLIVWLLSACGGTPTQEHEIFDEQSGNTLLVVSEPIVFARERNDVAAYARDYATLVAVEVDTSGTYKDYILLYRWSTVDQRMSPAPGSADEQLQLMGDGRELTLAPLSFPPHELQVLNLPFIPNHATKVASAFAVEVATLRFAATSKNLTLVMPREPLTTPFRLWHDGRGALTRFVGEASTAQ